VEFFTPKPSFLFGFYRSFFIARTFSGGGFSAPAAPARQKIHA
jgi:hypothetical protein